GKRWIPILICSSFFTSLSDTYLNVTLIRLLLSLISFFFNDTAPTEIYTLSLHDALPICVAVVASTEGGVEIEKVAHETPDKITTDRKSTRLNSSHVAISYAVFCLKKKKENANDNSVEEGQDGGAENGSDA